MYSALKCHVKITKAAGPNKFQRATAIVTVNDTDDNPANGVWVYGQWSSSTADNDSGQTNIINLT